jgi:anaerobic ribonucleoside-triphosphate reductase activating protein
MGTINLGGIIYHCETAAPWESTEIFLKGCLRNCDGCFNQSLRSFDNPDVFDIDELVELLVDNVPYKRVTISGGEPFLQPIALAELLQKLKDNEFYIVCYTGNTYEELTEMIQTEMGHNQVALTQILKCIDLLVDGEYNKDKRLPKTGVEPGHWVGSYNQRVIQLPRSLAEGRIVLWT